ncbi:hypothetical protein AVEN_69266-1 [Araneus ventricosus]|uniref:Uncharacterized protein n=1 Tax=Araneus ventricosus TaxID=182803 RepID=A0A4Y2G5I6_ARAVE|nr:hypothetical protein AVEN_69266-1 [Araneus ventricosus]
METVYSKPFIAPKANLKVVLLANGNLPSVPVAYSVDMKETYENISRILDKICYDYNWKHCADLKVVALHYIVRKWPRRGTSTPGQKNVVHDPLVPKENIYLPPLYIKLRLIKQFVKAMDKTGDEFKFLKTKFPRLSEATIKKGNFVGPEIRQLVKDSTFMKHLNRKEKRAFKNVYVNFLGKKQSDD